MDDTLMPGDLGDGASSTPVLGEDLPRQRDCTRCDGAQHLVGSSRGMGKYVCDTCQMAVGFDFEARPVEFLVSRGTAARYTQDRFGSRLLAEERRLSAPTHSNH